MTANRKHLTLGQVGVLADANWYAPNGANAWVGRVFHHHCYHHAADFDMCDAAICVKARAVEVAAYVEIMARDALA